MAGSPYVQFAGPSYHLTQFKGAIQSAINCYPARLDGDTWMMQGVPGTVLVSDLGAEIRGQRDVEGRHFVVSGGSLYELVSGVPTVRGSLATSTGVVGMAHNATQLVIVDGAHLYVYTLATNVLTEITVAGWLGSADVHEMDGYMVFVEPDTDRFYLSAIDDASTIDAGDVSNADSLPDGLLAHTVSHRQLWLFGRYSSEIWINSGNPPPAFPFTRYQSYTLEVGIVGPHAHCRAADSVFWVGRTRTGQGIVYMAVGNQPQRVSTMAVEQALAGSTDITSATLWAYQTAGHEFVGINAPGLDSTWVFDVPMQQWHERAEWDEDWLPERARCHTSMGNEVYAGDSDGRLVRLDANVHTLDSRVLVRERTWPHMLSPASEPVQHRGVELSMRTGSDVMGVVTLQMSNDGGQTFGSMLQRSLGAIGQWMQRVRWLGLGTTLSRVYRIRCSDPVPFEVYSATVDAS